jgi:sporulation protein YlmC with PRC-barrel domain
MKTLHSLSIVAALGLASAVYAQAQTSPNTTTETSSSPKIADSTTQQLRDPVSSLRVADAGPSTSVRGTEAPKLVGMKVQTASGDSLGQIKDVVIDKSGQTSYAVIAYGATLNVAAKQTAVPWAAVSPMIQGDKLVMDQSQLEQAPVLSNSRKLDPSSGTWSRDANVYWRSVKMRSMDPQPSSAPGAIPPKQ